MPPRPRQRGVVVVYASVFMVALIGVVSLAVDWGRVQTAKTELQDGADAAARYAAAGLFDGTYVAKAQAAGSQNRVDGTTLTIQAADVTSGNWNTTTRAFTAGGSPTNAVRVYGRRTATLGNAIPLMFGRIVGMNTASIQATSIARQSSLAAVGINSLTLNGGGVIQRKSGEPGGVGVASDGAITSAAGSTIGGDVLYRTTPALSGTTGGRLTYLGSDFTYAAPAVPGGVGDYGTIYLTSGTNYIAGNVYCSGDIYAGGTASIVLAGDTNIYVGGTATFTGNMTVTTNGYRMFLYSVNSGSVTYSNSNAMPGIIYAPNSAVSLNGPGVINGSVLGKTVSISTTLNFNATSAIPAKPTGGGDPMCAGGVVTMK